MESFSFGHMRANDINRIETDSNASGEYTMRLIYIKPVNGVFDKVAFSNNIAALTNDQSPEIKEHGNALIYEVRGNNNLKSVCAALDKKRDKYPLRDNFTQVFLGRLQSVTQPQQRAPHPHKEVLDALNNYIQKELDRLPPGDKYNNFNALIRRVWGAYNRTDNVGEIQKIIMDTATVSLHRRHGFWDSLLNKLGIKAKSEVTSSTNFQRFFQDKKNDHVMNETIEKSLNLKEEDVSTPIKKT